jgi:hypothetical protein
MKKLQTPSTRSRRHEEAEVPDQPERSASLPRRLHGLELGIWWFSGAWCLVLGAFIVLPAATIRAQNTPHIGYVYPAGGERGDTYFVNVGGQFLDGVTNAYVSGNGVKVSVVDFNKPMPQGQFNQLRDQLRELQDRKQAARREPNSTNTWSAADEKEMTALREKMLKNPPNRQGNPAIAETVTLKVVMATNAAAGEREIRLGTPNGLSNPMVFHVGDLREYSAPLAKIPNPEAERFRERMGKPAETPVKSDLRVTLPAVVNGQIMPGEVDHIRFAARKGQRIVVRASARELIPYLADAVPGWFQATLALFDAKGRELAYTDDFRFNPDPVLVCEIPKDGDYALEIKDAIYRGREDFVYRLTLGELPFVASVFPLGGPAGKPLEVEFTGYNLAASNRTGTVEFTEPGIHQLVVTNAGFVSNPVLFTVDTLPETLEQEPNNAPAAAQRVELPLIINGRIGQPGDVDVFRFEGPAGSEVVAEVKARRLNSPLDSQLQLTDASGKMIAFNDDSEDKGAGLETHHADSYIRATLPTDGTFYLQLGDTQQKGGVEFSYRLRLSAPQPDFELRVVPSSLAARAGASVPLTVYALRKDGFTNAISLGLLNPPPGFKLNGASVPADQEKVRLTLSVPSTPTPEPISLALEGRARFDGKPIAHLAVPADDLMQAFIYRHLVPALELKVAVLGRGLQRSPPRILSETPVKIPIGGTARVKIGAPGVFVDRFELELNEPPEGISIRKVSPSRDGADIELAADLTKAKPGQRGNLIVSAYAARPNEPNKPKGPGNLRRAPIATLPAIPFEIVLPP